jgi:hypothetical protein
MRTRWFTLLWIVPLLLAACAAAPSQPVTDGAAIQWDRSAATVVFRADVTGGAQDPFAARNDIPPCTLYGDNRVVWTNDLGQYNTQVLEDRLTDDQIRTYVNYLALNEQLYSFKARAELPSNPSPVVERLTLFVNGVNHVTDAFSGWDTQVYLRILDNCRKISMRPVLVVPAAAYLSAQVEDYDPMAISIYWDSAANGLSLAELAVSGERKWLTGQTVTAIWNVLRGSPPSVQFTENEITYAVALEVPNLTAQSPAAPAS